MWSISSVTEALSSLETEREIIHNHPNTQSINKKRPHFYWCNALNDQDASMLTHNYLETMSIYHTHKKNLLVKKKTLLIGPPKIYTSLLLLYH